MKITFLGRGAFSRSYDYHVDNLTQVHDVLRPFWPPFSCDLVLPVDLPLGGRVWLHQGEAPE